MNNKENKQIRKIISEQLDIIFEASTSKAQQRFFGMVEDCKTNPSNCEKYGKSIKDAAENMKRSDIDDFAKTKHKGLPNKLEENDLDKNPLDGMSNDQARKFVYKAVEGRYKDGLYSDEYWNGKQDIFNALNNANIDYVSTTNNYYNWPVKDSSQSSGKKWNVEVYFTNNNNTETVLNGQITAAGAGSVADPLDAYDINFTIF